jgi:hypothetical protein
MARAFALLTLALTALMASGCATCCNPFDYDYLYQGGAWVRNDPCYGRVGSAFTPEVGSKVLPDQVAVQSQQPTPARRSAPVTEPVRPNTSLGESYLPGN